MIYVKIWWKFRSCDGPVAQDTRECAHDQVLLFMFSFLCFNFSESASVDMSFEFFFVWESLSTATVTMHDSFVAPQVTLITAHFITEVTKVFNIFMNRQNMRP